NTRAPFFHPKRDGAVRDPALFRTSPGVKDRPLSSVKQHKKRSDDLCTYTKRKTASDYYRARSCKSYFFILSYICTRAHTRASATKSSNNILEDLR
ncbi:MAG: hypothetical protein K6G71_07675, partial [Clostridiales bacterium]|nr:hypothetical protein [Clostridiales bacterium]